MNSVFIFWAITETILYVEKTVDYVFGVDF